MSQPTLALQVVRGLRKTSCFLWNECINYDFRYNRLTRWLLVFLEYKRDVERPAGREWQITPQGAARE